MNEKEEQRRIRNNRDTSKFGTKKCHGTFMINRWKKTVKVKKNILLY